MQATSPQATSPQATSPYVDPHADPHDAIVELLHNHAQRIANDPSKLNITPDGDKPAPSKPTAPSVEEDVHAALNDNAIRPGEFRPQAASARRGGILSRALLTLCAGVAVTIAWHTYADEAKERLSQFVPQLFASTPATAQDASATEPQQPGTVAQATAPQPASAEAAPAQAAATTAAQPVQQEAATATSAAPAAPAAATQAALPPDVTQTIEAMSREIAALKQTVEQLKANQQHSRDTTKAGDHEARRKPATSTQAAKPASASSQQRTSTTPPPSSTPPYAAAVQRAQASAPYVPPPPAYRPSPTSSGTVQRDAYIPPPPPTPAPVPRRLPPEPGYETVPRPPMPLQY